jgi:hypothetical protein
MKSGIEAAAFQLVASIAFVCAVSETGIEFAFALKCIASLEGIE